AFSQLPDEESRRGPLGCGHPREQARAAGLWTSQRAGEGRWAVDVPEGRRGPLGCGHPRGQQ
ncbi:hypothetical protein NHX12_007344, partial [Muraenolepis orangiensis]